MQSNVRDDMCRPRSIRTCVYIKLKSKCQRDGDGWAREGRRTRHARAPVLGVSKKENNKRKKRPVLTVKSTIGGAYIKRGL